MFEERKQMLNTTSIINYLPGFEINICTLEDIQGAKSC